MSIKQLSVFAENKPGAIVEITDALASRSIDIRAMSVADTQNFGVLRLIVSDVDAWNANESRVSLMRSSAASA